MSTPTATPTKSRSRSPRRPDRTCTISNDTTGYAELLAWIVDHAPGPRLVVSIEGTRSYGVGLARAAAAAGLTVLECEQPNRKARRGKGKSDPIDAHLAVLAALRLDADRLPTPRADGDREALRILLGARQELTTTGTAQTNRLRALLLGGDDTDRGSPAARSPRPASPAWPAAAHPATPAGSRPSGTPRSAGSPWPCATTAARSRPTAASCRPSSTRSFPGLTDRRGIGPVSAAQAIVRFSHPGRCRNDAAFAALAGTSPLPASSGRTVRHRLNRGGDRALNSASTPSP